MKAVVIRRHGGPEVLSYDNIPRPRPRKRYAIVRIGHCAVNHLDLWVRNGMSGKQVRFPHILGCDISGKLEEGFGKFRKGEKVVVYPAVKPDLPRTSFSIIGGFGRHRGGYAQMVQVPEENIIRQPDWLDDVEACSLNVSYLTAWNMLERSRCKKDDTILVWGASSGVGSAAILLGRAMGLRIIAVTSGKKNAGLAKEIGAHHVIERDKQDVASQTLRLTSPRGVDAVIDHVGAKTWPTSIEVLRVGGRMIACGTTSGGQAAVNIRSLYSKEASIVGAYLGTREQLVSLHRFMKLKKVRPIIDSVLDLKDAGIAHRKMEEGRQFGKIVLRIPS